MVYNKSLFFTASLFSVLLFACSDNSTKADVFDAASVCPESKRGYFTDDRDGQMYKYTTIGKQVWMAQNLNYALPETSVLEPDSGIQVTPVVRCYEDDNNCVKNGYLYNWYAAYYSCPNGWHLPSEKEWQTLIKNMGGDEEANARLRSTSGWKALNRGENLNGTDDCGFSLAPDTASDKYKLFVWTSTDHYDGVGKISVGFISYRKDIVFNSTEKSIVLLTVRCIKD